MLLTAAVPVFKKTDRLALHVGLQIGRRVVFNRHARQSRSCTQAPLGLTSGDEVVIVVDGIRDLRIPDFKRVS